MARRLVERGVRFVQIFIESQIWDNHSNLKTELGACCAKTDQPAAALLKDLKQRGLLDSTLVIWGGEFGRLPLSQMRTMNAGRDHGPGGFSSWLAGGGVKKGHVHGATDEIGYKAVVDPVSPHDFHATLLHLLGMNHEKLVFNHNGLNERLSGVEPSRIVEGIFSLTGELEDACRTHPGPETLTFCGCSNEHCCAREPRKVHFLLVGRSRWRAGGAHGQTRRMQPLSVQQGSRLAALMAGVGLVEDLELGQDQMSHLHWHRGEAILYLWL